LKHLARKQYLQLLYLFQILMHQSSLFKIPKYTSFTQRISYRMFIQIHQETLGQYYIAFFLHISWQLIKNDTGMSRQQENKNLLRKRQTRRPRLKPGSEREGHTSFSHDSSVTYLQIFTTNFNFCKF
jgi:hypothetical protein